MSLGERGRVVWCETLHNGACRMILGKSLAIGRSQSIIYVSLVAMIGETGWAVPRTSLGRRRGGVNSIR